MMKKFGFTLAEVLITLGIIGVVAALTAPALVQNAGTAKVGPTLSKVVSTLENANEQLLHDEDATDLSKIAETNLEYSDLLSKYISGSSYETENFDSSTFEPAISHYNGDSPGSFSSSCRVFYFSDNILLVFGSGFNSDDYSYSPKGSFELVKDFAQASGYSLEDTPLLSSFGGFRDWFISNFNKPGFTIEVRKGN